MNEANCGRGTRLRTLDQLMLMFSAWLCFQGYCLLYEAMLMFSAWLCLQGYCLLYEAMLPSVLLARDRWLKPVRGVAFIRSSVDLNF